MGRLCNNRRQTKFKNRFLNDALLDNQQLRLVLSLVRKLFEKKSFI